MQKSYAAKNNDTRLKGDKLIFTKSGNVNRDKMGTRSMADEVISGDTVKLSVSVGSQIENNWFALYATTVDSFKKVRESLVEIMRIPTISSASHNVIAYRVVNKDGIQYEGSDNECYVPYVIMGHKMLKSLYHHGLDPI